ncbi:discoidin domain-containing protein [Candidatus Sumerlaeota bacterium]|nr:discoidin domain-containing protein [Candidatus Sumerlaeota bacterium]
MNRITSKLLAATLLVTLTFSGAAQESQQTDVTKHPGYIQIDGNELLPAINPEVEVNLTPVLLLLMKSTTLEIINNIETEDASQAEVLKSVYDLVDTSKVQIVQVRVFSIPDELVEQSQANAVKFVNGLISGGWQTIVRVPEDNVNVLLRANESSIQGGAVIVADGDEMVIVNVAADIQPEKIGKIVGPLVGKGLSGNLDFNPESLQDIIGVLGTVMEQSMGGGGGAMTNPEWDMAPPAPEPAPAPENNIAKDGWKLVRVDSESTYDGDVAMNAFDGDPNTTWHTQWNEAQPEHPHELVIDLGQTYEIKGFQYQPRTNGQLNGTIAEYEFFVSGAPDHFNTPASKGAFTDGLEATVVEFAPVKGRYVMLRSLSEQQGLPFASAGEIYLIKNTP